MSNLAILESFKKYASKLALSTKNMSREEWLTARQTGIGGSDISAIMGVNPYATAYDVYISKTQPVEDTAGEPAYWGTTLEPVVATEFAKRNDLKIQNVNFMMRHPVHTFAVANIDRAVINPEISGNVRFKDGKLTTDTILEIKTASEYVAKDWGDEESDQVPDQYMCQAQWYMGVTDTQVCYMAVLIGGNKYRQYRIERNQELIDVLFEVAEDFWVNNVLVGVAPEATTLQNAKDKYPKYTPDAVLDVSIEDEAVEVFNEFVELKEAEKLLKKQIEAAQTKLICTIGDNEALAIDGDIAVTYKAQVSNRFDSNSFKKDMPELAAKYVKQSASRVMRVK